MEVATVMQASTDGVQAAERGSAYRRYCYSRLDADWPGGRPRRERVRNQFGRFSRIASDTAGSPAAFAAAVALIVVWAASGPAFGFTDTWQLVINTSTTILTFLMVFIIQNSQNRDSRALHAKLDELIKQQKSADNALLGAEDLTDVELAALKERYEKLAVRTATTRSARTSASKSAPAKAGQSKAAPGKSTSARVTTTTSRQRGNGSPSRATS